ncbi:HNH endonuclease [Robertmurraya sp. FSL R5-0851]
MCCKKCRIPVGIKDCHIDHIVSGLRGSNKFKNLRTLCRRCHVLRVDYRHRGMIYKALKDGVIPVNWRNHLWK